MNTPVLIGIDPGFASIGVAVVALGSPSDHVVAVKVFRTQKSNAKAKLLASDDNVRRAREIARELKALIQVVTQDYNVVGICAEAMSFPRNASNAAKMAMTWGILVALSGDLPIFQCSPQELKLRVAGSKTASKEEVEAALLEKFGNGFMSTVKVPAGQHEHLFDALGAIVACMGADQVRMVRKMMDSVHARD